MNTKIESGNAQTDATYCWPTTPNIVSECYMLRPFAHPVACCCAKFETGQTLSPVQTDARLLTNNSQQCWDLLEELYKRIQHCCATLRRSRNKRNVGSCWLKSLTGFKLGATKKITRINIQQHATGCANRRNI